MSLFFSTLSVRTSRAASLSIIMSIYPARSVPILLFVATSACGGLVLLDPAANGPSKDGVSPDGKVTPLGVACGATPEVLTVVTGALSHVEDLTAGPNELAYIASSREAAPARALRVVKLGSKADVLIVPEKTPQSPTGDSLALIGTTIFYLSQGTESPLANGRGLLFHTPVTGGMQSSVTEDVFVYHLGASCMNLSGSPGGWMFGSARGRGNTYDSVFSWTDGGVNAVDKIIPSQPDISKVVAFDGGAVSISRNGRTLDIYIDENPQDFDMTAASLADGHVSKFVDAGVLAGVDGTIVYWVSEPLNASPPRAELRRQNCGVPRRPGAGCDDLYGSSVLYTTTTAGAAPRLGHMRVRPDGSVVIAEGNDDGVRPTTRVLLVKDGQAKAIGGEGVSGVVNDVTAVTTYGNCIYWAQEGAEGTRIMKVGR